MWRRTIGLARDSGLTIVSLPLVNQFLQGRIERGTPRWRGIPLRRELKEAGVAVALASDNCRDPYHAFGDHDMVEVFGAGVRMGHLEVENANRLPETALAALRTADFVVDLSHSHDPEIRRLAPHGTRTLVVLESPEILERLLPRQEDKARVLHAQKCIRESRRMRVTTAAGTDFEVQLGELQGNCQYGFSDEPGHWDQWWGALVTTYGNEGSANGTVVIAEGDIIFPQKEYVRAPIRLTIDGGYTVAMVR